MSSARCLSDCEETVPVSSSWFLLLMLTDTPLDGICLLRASWIWDCACDSEALGVVLAWPGAPGWACVGLVLCCPSLGDVLCGEVPCATAALPVRAATIRIFDKCFLMGSSFFNWRHVVGVVLLSHSGSDSGEIAQPSSCRLVSCKQH